MASSFSEVGMPHIVTPFVGSVEAAPALVAGHARARRDGAFFYVTFTIVDWLPVFVSEAACKIVAESLNFCHRQKGLRINAYVIMPTHFHVTQPAHWRFSSANYWLQGSGTTNDVILSPIFW